MYDHLGDFLKEHWDYLRDRINERKNNMTEPNEVIEDKPVETTDDEIVDMDAVNEEEEASDSEVVGEKKIKE